VIKRIIAILTVFLAVIPCRVFALTPNDPDFSRQWYLNKMSVPAAWDYSQGGDVVVAVLDTGVDFGNPELKNNEWTNPNPGNTTNNITGYVNDIHGWNFIENDNNVGPHFNSGWTEAGVTHGTVIAGIIGAVGNNLSGIAGINWKVKIMSLRVLDSSGEGDPATAANAIDYAVAHGARVLNFSFVTNEHDIALDEAIARAAKAGVLIVSAAGNNKNNNGDNLDKTPMYPVCSDGPDTNYVLGVAATDENDKKAQFSDYGSNCVDVSAPGSDIISTQVYNPSLISFDSFTRSGWSGTSVAAPMVSGLASLLLSANPGLSRETLMQIIISTADPIDALNPLYRGELGTGRINAFRAMQMTLGLPVESIQAVPSPAGKTSYIAVGAPTGSSSEVKVYSADGKLYSKFFAFSPTFRGGVRVAVGDVDGDGVPEIITGAGPGGGPQVRVFDMKGNLKSEFFAYASGFHGGVSVATGDVDADGTAEIITGAGPGGGPQVRVFSADGTVKEQFFAYDKNVTTGVNVAAGDINGDGIAEIITAPATHGGSQPVKYFSGSLVYLGMITFLAPTAAGGVNVVIADVAGDGTNDVIISRANAGTAVTVIVSGIQPKAPFAVSGAVGVGLGALDLNGDGRFEILTSPGAAAGKFKLFDGSGNEVSGFTANISVPAGASFAGFSVLASKL
jgi:Subtilase family/FG-GAP-like repeat